MRRVERAQLAQHVGIAEKGDRILQLVVNSFGASLRREGGLLRVQCAGRHVDLAPTTLSSILITTGVHFSTDAIQLAAEHNIDVVLLDKFGSPYGRFWPAKMGSTAAIRRRQVEVADSDEGVKVVREWTRAKLANQRGFLQELARRRPEREDEFAAACLTIETEMAKLDTLDGGDMDARRQEILGCEARGAAAYWRVVRTLPPKAFQFEKRTRHPATDPVNAMLNYAYGVLYSEVERACIVAGLDPFVGLLHTDNYNKRSMVYDLVEPFRVWAERIVITLFTGRRCREDMFHADDDGVVLEKSAKELLLASLNEYLEAGVHYKVKSSRSGRTRSIKRRACIQAEAHTFANRLLGKDGGLPEVMETRTVFEEKQE